LKFLLNEVPEWLRWSSGQHAGLWYPGLWVRSWPKPSDFSGKKILSMPSFGREVKPFASCRRFATCKRSLNGVKASFRQNYGTFSPTVPPFATRSTRVDGDMEASGGESWNV
jgi:hypothetical protein